MSGIRRYQRDTFNGKFLGVCAGFGNLLGIDPLWIRLGLIAVILLGLFPLVFVYFLIAMITTKKPPESYTGNLDNLSRVFGDPTDAKPASRKGDE